MVPGRKTALLVIFSLNILFFSCNNEKKDFNMFLNKLDSPILLDTLKEINRIIMLREECVFYFRFDTILISFATYNNCQPEIKNISKVIDDKQYKIGKHDEHLMKLKVNYYYQLMKDYGFIGVENNNNQTLSVIFKLKNFNKNTVPDDNIQDTEKNEFNTGILVFDYGKTYVNTSEYYRYKPIKLNNNWYFYKISSDLECNCIE